MSGSVSFPNPDPAFDSDARDPALWAQLVAHEGLRLKPYRDTVGKLTIGVGRNLDDTGLRPAEAMFLFCWDVRAVEQGLDARLPWWRRLDPVRRAVVIDMAFNMGVAGLMGFGDMLAALRAGRFGDAAQAMLRSRWAGQVGRRAATLARMMRTGESFVEAGGDVASAPSPGSRGDAA